MLGYVQTAQAVRPAAAAGDRRHKGATARVVCTTPQKTCPMSGSLKPAAAVRATPRIGELPVAIIKVTYRELQPNTP